MAGVLAVAEAIDKFLLFSRQVERFAWLVFALVWIASWFGGGPADRRRQSTASLAAQIVLYVAGVVLLFVTKGVPLGEVDLRLLPRSDFLTGAAVVLTVGGIGLALWARWVLGRNWSGKVAIKEGQTLVESGPYRVVRNPIALGLTSALLGTALLRCSVRSFLAVGVFLAVFLWKTRLERQLLSDAFHARYREYCRRVKAFIPFVI